MIKLEITIKEINSYDFKEMTAIGTEISLKEIGKHASKYEREVSNILKKRLNDDKKIQVETKNDELKAELEKLLKSL
jgi:hypothetical protein